MNTVCPSEERLKSLIMEAFDELSAPDSARIGQIASTLANKTKNQANRRSKPRHHWLFWVLLGGSMTAAAWWGGSHFLPQPTEIIETDSIEIQQEPTKIILPNNSKKNTQPPAKKGADKDSSVIYQRELYQDLNIMLSIRHSLLISTALFLFWSAFASTAHAFGPTECAANRLGGDLVCTAADVSITGLAISGGAPSCIGGTSATFDLDLTVNSATPNRYDIGVFISNDGNDPTLTSGSGGPASCTVGILPPNDPPFRNLDPGPVAGVTDVCGDVNGSMNGGTGVGTFTMTNVSVACQSIDGSSGNLYIPFVVSWDNTAGATCQSINDVFPNTKSKCNSPTVLQSTVPVVVLPTITKTDNSPVIFSDGDTAYTVVITNTTGAILSGAVFTDPAVPDLDVGSITCSADGGATCPTFTIADVQGGGVTIPDMPIDSSVTFTIDAELDDDATGTITNVANVTVSGQTNSDSDEDTILDPDVVPEMTKTDGSSTLAPGASTTYLVVINNTTDDDLENAVFKDPAVTDLTVNSITCSPSGGATCPVIDIAAIQGAGLTLPDIPDEGSLTFTINATLSATATLGATITNTASVTAGGQTNFASDSNTIQTGAAALTCGPIPNDFPIFSTGDDLDIDEDVTIDLGSGPIAVEEGDNNGNAIDTTLPADNNVTDATLASLPTIEPPTFPATGGQDVDVAAGTTQTIDIADNPPAPGNPGAYNDINVDDNAILNFTGGGPFYIDRLRAEDTATINFNAGTYFIDRFEVRDDDVTINVNGPVRIFIGDHFTTGNNDDRLSVNAGGAVSDLVIFLYPNAEFDMDGEELDFTGVIYGPNSGDIKIDDNSTIKGAIIGGDEIDLDDNVKIIYDSTVKNAVDDITTCDGAVFDHYAISHIGNGITCAPTAITFRGHTSGDTTTAPPAGTTITVSINMNTLGTWSLNTGNGTFTALANGMATYVFDGTETEVILDLLYPQAGTINLNVTDGTISESEDPDLTIGRAIFEWSEITTQISGKNSDIGFESQNSTNSPPNPITIRALRESDSDPAVCVSAFQNSTVNIDLGAECSNPIACAGQQLSINGTPIATNNDDGIIDRTSAYTTVPILFDANGFAELVINYPDAGLMQLHSLYNTTIANFATGTAGSSNEFVVRPLALRIPTITGNNAATDSTGMASFVAGVDFSFDLEGVLWQQTDDTNDDGIADGYGDIDPTTNPADLSDNGITPNFNASADLTTTLIQPVGGQNPALSTTSATIMGGTGTATTSWPEVGIIELNAQVTDYIISGINILGRSSYVGRFYPDRFNITDNTPDLADSCGAFSYMDQPIDYATNPVITLEALEEGGGTTLNYDRGGFWKYTQALSDFMDNRTYTDNAVTPATLTFTTNPLVTATELTGDTNSDGMGAVTVAGDQIAYQRPADPRDTAGGGAEPAIPFNADVNLVLTPADLTDGDGACYDPDNNGTCDENYIVTNIGNTQVRFGRLKIDSAFGSELVNLQLPVTAEYYDSLINDFVIANDDMCTTLTDAPIGVLPIPLTTYGHIYLDDASYTGNLSAPVPGVSPGDTIPTLSAFAAGQATLTLSAPGVGNDGSVVVSPLLNNSDIMPPVLQPWLQFDWDGDGTHDNDPTATATFGIYRGNDSTIYLRELYQVLNQICANYLD